MFCTLISMPRFENINFSQNRLKINSFLQKNAKVFESWELHFQISEIPPAHCRFLVARLVRAFQFISKLKCHYAHDNFNDFGGPISSSLRLGNTVPSKEVPQQWPLT